MSTPEPTSAPMTAAPTTSSIGSATTRPSRRRDRAGTALAVVAVVVLLVGSLAWWARTTLYDTGVVTAKADEIAADEDVQAATVALLLTRVVQPALAQGYDAVPAGLGGLLETVAGDEVVDLATQGIQGAVRSQQAHDITVRLAAAIQSRLVDGDGDVAFTPGEITAVVAPSLSDNRVVSSVVAFADRTGCCTVVLATRDDLPFVWQHVELVRALGVILPGAALVLALAALGVSTRRARTTLVLGLGVALVGVITLVGVWVGGTLGVDAVADPSDPAHDLVHRAASTVYAVSERELVEQAGWLLLVGTLVAAGAGAWLAWRRRAPTAAPPSLSP